jgi:MFS-type transporter involved in bile tolerance (Atg22 family)
MNLAADMGRHSGRATPSLHDTPHRHFEEATGRQSTYLLPITVQTNRATSFFGLYAIAGTITVWMGPLLVEYFTLWSNNQRIGMASISLLFLIGLAVLFSVKMPEQN